MTTETLPIGTLSPGALCCELTTTPDVGDTVYVYSRGRVRMARVAKVTPTRAQVEYATASNPTSATRPWLKLAGQSAEALDPTGILLLGGMAASGLPPHALARSWRVETSAAGFTGRQLRGRQGGHKLVPVEGTR